jgi:hypothetical protein
LDMKQMFNCSHGIEFDGWIFVYKLKLRSMCLKLLYRLQRLCHFASKDASLPFE